MSMDDKHFTSICPKFNHLILPQNPILLLIIQLTKEFVQHAMPEKIKITISF